MKKFRLVKNKRGEICAISYGRQWILHITEGTSLNAHFHDFWEFVVYLLNDPNFIGGNTDAVLEKMIKEWKKK